MSKPVPRDRLHKLCGLFGSQHDGENGRWSGSNHRAGTTFSLRLSACRT